MLTRTQLQREIYNYYDAHSFFWQVACLIVSRDPEIVGELKELLDKILVLDHALPLNAGELFDIVSIIFSPKAFLAPSKANDLLTNLRNYFNNPLQNAFIFLMNQRILSFSAFYLLIQSKNPYTLSRRIEQLHHRSQLTTEELIKETLASKPATTPQPSSKQTAQPNEIKPSAVRQVVALPPTNAVTVMGLFSHHENFSSSPIPLNEQKGLKLSFD